MKPTKVSVSLKKFSISDREILNKKVNTSKKYLNVKPRIRSGYTAKDREELENDMKKYYKIRTDEVFRRISLINLMQLMVTHVKETQAKTDVTHESDFNECAVKSNTEYHALDDSCNEMPFLIVDVRSGQSFHQAHIAAAISHPASKMSRTVGWECGELIAYKNHRDFIIVAYDDQESIAPAFVTTLIHRGYENAFMLSGGLRLAVDKVGYPFVTSNADRTLSHGVIDFMCGELAVFDGVSCAADDPERSDTASVDGHSRSASKADTFKGKPWR